MASLMLLKSPKLVLSSPTVTVQQPRRRVSGRKVRRHELTYGTGGAPGVQPTTASGL